MKPIEPIDLSPGEVVEKPGVYNMTLAHYHTDCCDGPSVSSSDLRTLILKSPAHAWDKSAMNPERTEDDPDAAEAKHFRLGRAGHLLLLEPEKFKAAISIRPSQFDSWRSKDAKTWRAVEQRRGKTVLDSTEYENVVGVANALRGHAVHRDGILDGNIEASIIFRDRKTGLWVKSRPDAIPASANMLVDLKIVTDARGRPIRNATLYDFGYDMQLALAGIAMERVLGRTIEDYTLVFCENKRPYGIRVAPISPTAIYYARLKLRKALDTFATLLRAKQRWPSFEAEDGEHIVLSKDEEQRLADQVGAGLLPKEF